MSSRRLWIPGLIVLIIGVTAFALRGRIAGAVAMYRDYETIPYDTGWIRLRDGSQVSLERGSRLRALKQVGPNGMAVILAGTARFRAQPPDTSRGKTSEGHALGVRTRNADVISARADFAVRVNGDTTEIAVHRPGWRTFIEYMQPSHVLVVDRVSDNPTTVNETEIVRVVRGSRATIVGRLPSNRSP